MHFKPTFSHDSVHFIPAQPACLDTANDSLFHYRTETECIIVGAFLSEFCLELLLANVSKYVS